MYLMVKLLVQQEHSVLRIREDNSQENMLGQKVKVLQLLEKGLMQKEVIQKHQDPLLTQRVLVQQHQVIILMQKDGVKKHQEQLLIQKDISQQHQEQLLMQKGGAQQHKEIINMSKVNIIYQTQQVLISWEMVVVLINQMLTHQTGQVMRGLLVMFILVERVGQTRMMGLRNWLLKNMQIVKHQLYKVMLLKIRWML